METSVVAFLLSVLVNRFAEEASSKISKTTFQKIASLRQKTQEELEEDFQTRLVWNKLETSNGEEPPIQTLEIIADTLQGKINTEPDFAREAEEVQHLFETELQSNYSTDFQEYVRQIQRLTNKIKVLQKDVDDIQQEIKENVGRGDYLGKDPGILSGNQNFIQNIQGGVKNIQRDVKITIHLNQEYNQRILTQIEQIRGKITQFFTVKESMDELDKIRQPIPISTGYVEQEWKVRFPLSFFGDVSWRTLRKNKKEDDINQDNKLVSEESYFKKIRDIESQLGATPEEDKALLQSLGSIADEVNLQISKLNNSFILALYPASSSKELVANMVSKIGYKEIREEAETHLNVISKLLEKLNNLMEKFNIENHNTERKLSNQQNNIVSHQTVVEIIKNSNPEDIINYFDLIKNLVKKSENE